MSWFIQTLLEAENVSLHELIAAMGLWTIRPGFIINAEAGNKIMRGNTIGFCTEFVIGRSWQGAGGAQIGRRVSHAVQETYIHERRKSS